MILYSTRWYFTHSISRKTIGTTLLLPFFTAIVSHVKCKELLVNMLKRICEYLKVNTACKGGSFLSIPYSRSFNIKFQTSKYLMKTLFSCTTSVYSLLMYTVFIVHTAQTRAKMLILKDRSREIFYAFVKCYGLSLTRQPRDTAPFQRNSF
jgi:hypothetical protein